jgi:putative glycosyltransferase (TIGR04372 family)
MVILQNLNKHFEQIKKGRILVIVKKLRSFIYLLLQIPFYLISIPLVLIIRLIKPWYLIRWQELISSRMGHFALNTELYCCERDAEINLPSQRHIDLFCLRKYVCNRQLEKMWRRSRLIILPRWLLIPLSRVNRFFSLFISTGKEHEIEETSNDDRDVYNLLDKFSSHISFTDKEKLKGKEILKKFGLTKNAKFVCLIVRDAGYLNRHIEHEYEDRWQYLSYRDEDINKYVLAAEELARRGYYVFRMGIKVLKPLKSSNPKVIDYANSDMRSDFMDIYLGANCFFCITNGTGIDAIPAIFRRPLACIIVPFGYTWTYSNKFLLLTKHHINKRNQKELTVSEIFSFNVASAFDTKIYEINNIELKENSPEEIKDLVIEMDDRLNDKWKETDEDIMLQKKFWSIFKENIKNLNLEKPLHGKIKSKFGAKFLRENQNWIR